MQSNEDLGRAGRACCAVRANVTDSPVQWLQTKKVTFHTAAAEKRVFDAGISTFFMCTDTHRRRAFLAALM